MASDWEKAVKTLKEQIVKSRNQMKPPIEESEANLKLRNSIIEYEAWKLKRTL